MNLFTIKRLTALWLVNHVYVGTRCFEKKRKLLNSIGYEIGEGTKVVGPIFNTGKLVVGRNCWIGRDLRIEGNGSVIIGDSCDIAPSVTFLTGGHEIGDSNRRAGDGHIYTIHIGSGTWIGARATIGRNVTVGSGSVVAACACVMSSVNENTMVGGVPAKVIKILKDDEDVA